MSSSGILTIDLAAIQSNWEFVKSQALPAVETGAVIKANAYGLGAVQISEALLEAGCKTFFVATKEEALVVRSSFSADINVVVLGGIRKGDEDIFVDCSLIPVLYSKESIARWLAICSRRRIPSPCILKVDTGMTRLGLAFDDLLEISEAVFSHQQFNPVLLMSHLACADEYLHPQNKIQRDNFLVVLEYLKTYFPQIRASLANSSGVFLGKPWHFDLLRPGAALYGINPTPHLPNPLKPVVRLSLPILQIKDLLADSCVGYGAVHKAKKGTRLAVVAGGYADGINRTLGAKPSAKLLGARIEAVGRISMDTTIFDVGINDLSADELVGQLVDVIDDEFTLDFLTRQNASLGYEVLTSLGMRYKRIYRK